MTNPIVRAEERGTALIVPQINASYFGAILEGTEKTVELVRTIKDRVRQRAEEVLKGTAEVRRRGRKQVYYLDSKVVFGDKREGLLA